MVKSRAIWLMTVVLAVLMTAGYVLLSRYMEANGPGLITSATLPRGPVALLLAFAVSCLVGFLVTAFAAEIVVMINRLTKRP